MEPISIPDILDQVTRGQIRVPKFQRGFVWEADRVAYLMDSIYKRFPIGALLFWRSREKLKDERQLGPFALPEPKVDYPIDYVLDGQQRLTSIFGVFQSSLSQDGSVDWLDVFYDFEAGQTPQETQFVALRSEEVDAERHFPLSTFFNTSAYGKIVRQLPDETAERIDKVREVFQTANIPVESTSTEDRSTVAIIFERVNRQGVELDTFQLLTAWTWSEDFQLQDQFADLSEDIKPFGFGGLGGDTNLILRCCSAILTGDASPDALMNINGEQLRDNFDLVTNGIKGAIDYLRSNFNIQKLANLPFSTLLVPLSVFFAVKGSAERTISDAQRRSLNRWFWRSAFSRRYSSGVLRNLKADIEEVNLLKNGKDSKLGDFAVHIPDDFFRRNIFGIGNVNSKTFILLIARERPLNLISGQPVDLADKLKDANRAEFHHLMPRKFLADSKQDFVPDSVLANFVFLNRSENRELGGKAPSEYRSKLPNDVGGILERDLIPASLFDDNYERFILERSALLHAKALDVCEIVAESPPEGATINAA
jgi:hypothetical protein